MEQDSSASLVMDWFEHRGLRIRYAVREGTPGTIPLIMFNGIGQSLEILQPIIDCLDGVTVVTFDVPGAGLSDTPPLPWRFRKHAKLAAALLAYLNFDKVNVMGFSWGGALAQQFSHQFPEIASKLILVATPPGHIMIPGWPSVYLRMINIKRFVDRNYMRSVAGHIYGGTMRRDQTALDGHLNRLKAPSKRGYLYQVYSVYGWTSLIWLFRLKQPTLILQGTDDPMIPNINARIMAKMIPNARLEFVDCGHLFMLTKTEEICPMVKDFIREEIEENHSTESCLELAH